jgi:hypothetical protein
MKTKSLYPGEIRELEWNMEDYLQNLLALPNVFQGIKIIDFLLLSEKASGFFLFINAWHISFLFSCFDISHVSR